jgi:hypothetical protein
MARQALVANFVTPTYVNETVSAQTKIDGTAYLNQTGVPGGSVGSASGQGTALAIGAGTVAAVATASGAGSAVGIGASLFSAVATTFGHGTASAASIYTFGAVASAAGQGTAAAVALPPGSMVGTACGSASVIGVGATLISAIGVVAGHGSVSGIGISESDAVGLASGTSRVIGIGARKATVYPFDYNRSWSLQIYGSLIEGVAYDPSNFTMRVIFEADYTVDVPAVSPSDIYAIPLKDDPQAYIFELMARSAN